MKKTRKGETRDTVEIWVWMRRKGVSPTGIARDIEVTPQLVSSTICGYKNNRNVLRRLLKLGCPAELLGLPDDLAAEAAGDSGSLRPNDKIAAVGRSLAAAAKRLGLPDEVHTDKVSRGRA